MTQLIAPRFDALGEHRDDDTLSRARRAAAVSVASCIHPVRRHVLLASVQDLRIGMYACIFIRAEMHICMHIVLKGDRQTDRAVRLCADGCIMHDFSYTSHAFASSCQTWKENGKLAIVRNLVPLSRGYVLQ